MCFDRREYLPVKEMTSETYNAYCNNENAIIMCSHYCIRVLTGFPPLLCFGPEDDYLPIAELVLH